MQSLLSLIVLWKAGILFIDAVEFWGCY